MRAFLFNSWGRPIAEQEVRDSMDVLSLTPLYSNWAFALVRSRTGRMVEMFVR